MSNRSRSKGYNTNAVKVDKTSNVSSQDQFYGNQKSYNTTSAAIPTSNKKGIISQKNDAIKRK